MIFSPLFIPIKVCFALLNLVEEAAIWTIIKSIHKISKTNSTLAKILLIASFSLPIILSGAVFTATKLTRVTLRLAIDPKGSAKIAERVGGKRLKYLSIAGSALLIILAAAFGAVFASALVMITGILAIISATGNAASAVSFPGIAFWATVGIIGFLSLNWLTDCGTKIKNLKYSRKKIVEEYEMNEWSIEEDEDSLSTDSDPEKEKTRPRSPSFHGFSEFHGSTTYQRPRPRSAASSPPFPTSHILRAT